MGTLTHDQVNFFREHGYLLLERIFDDRQVASLCQEANWILELIVNSSLANDRLSTRMDWSINSRGQLMVRKIQPINDLSLIYTRIAEDRGLLDPLEQLMHDKPVLMEEKLNYKQPLASHIDGLPVSQRDDHFPVHNDWAYYKGQNYPQNILSSALLLDACSADNGPLHIWPDSHQHHLEHELLEGRLQVKRNLLDFEGGIDLIAPAGSLAIFHALLVHNSKPNFSGQPRRLMIYSHYPASFEMPPDTRNGPFRLRESPWERQYMRMKLAGQFTDRFTAPQTDGANVTR